MVANNISILTRGGLIARNVVFNLIGQGAPLVAAIFAIPILIRELGTERFGVLTLAWAVIGYFSLLDLGLGRALTKTVAEKLGTGEEDRIAGLVWTCLLLMFIFGLIGSFLLGLLSGWLVSQVLRVPLPLVNETLRSFYLLAISLPIVLTTAGLRGLLEAHQRFGVVNAIRTVYGIFTFLGPLVMLPFTRSLYLIIVLLAAARLMILFIYFLICFRTVPVIRRNVSIQRKVAIPLLQFGTWTTVSNVIGPIMDYGDRFLIGGMVSMTAVAYYTTPYEIAAKLFIIPNAIAMVMFPVFSTTSVRDVGRTSLLFGRALKCLFVILFPLVLVTMSLSHEGLEMWLGKEFAQNSSRVFQLLIMGVFVNSLARMPFDLIQGLGRPDLTAKIHLAELFLYLPLAWWMIGTYGIVGAAIAWLGRVFLDAVILFRIALALLPQSIQGVRRMEIILGAGLLILILAVLPMAPFLNRAYVLTILAAYLFAAWHIVPEPEERTAALGWLKRAFSPK